MSIVYDRIKELCNRRGITISKLESDLGFGNSSIKKWERTSSPSVDKVIKVANYFDVSCDYLLGRSDIEGSAVDIIEDTEVVNLKRAIQKMTPEEKDKMMQMFKLMFNQAFTD